MYFYGGHYYLVIIGMLLCAYASYKVNATFKRYSKVANKRGFTGADAARYILESQGITDVEVRHIRGNLTDNYNPGDNTLNLSDATYNSTSVAAIGVAAHECGHAIQHDRGYVPITLRNAILPFANIGSYLSWVLIVVGLVIGGVYSTLLLNVGIISFMAVVLFQIVTLPVEFNASSRALKILKTSGMLDSDELGMSRKVLSAAAMTYVAAVASSVLQLIRLIFIADRR